MNQESLKAYAQLLLTTGINLRQGQPLLINAEVDQVEFIRLLTSEAYKLGASEVHVNWRDGQILREKILNASDEVIDNPKEWLKIFYNNYMDEDMAVISFVSADPELMKGVPTDRLSRHNKATRSMMKDYYSRMMSNEMKWLVASLPTVTWANLLGLKGTDEEKLDALWHIIFTLCRLENVKESETFKEHVKRLQKRTQALNALNLKSLHYTCENGTDLTIDLVPNHLWMGGAEESTKGEVFCANIPTEEVFSAPLKTGVNGVVHNTKPLSYQGNTIDNFTLTFKDGKVIAYEAKVGQEVLKELLETDEASSYLGEVALVDHYSPISLSNRVYMETLYDENASCHLAFGQAYPICLKNGPTMDESELIACGLNRSLSHVDFMIGHEKMNIVGIDHDGKKHNIMVDGRLQV